MTPAGTPRRRRRPRAKRFPDRTWALSIAVFFVPSDSFFVAAPGRGHNRHRTSRSATAAVKGRTTTRGIGRISGNALVRPGKGAEEMSDDHALRKTVRRIWSTVLGAEVDDSADFFELGGHSFAAVQI